MPVRKALHTSESGVYFRLETRANLLRAYGLAACGFFDNPFLQTDQESHAARLDRLQVAGGKQTGSGTLGLRTQCVEHEVFGWPDGQIDIGDRPGGGERVVFVQKLCDRQISLGDIVCAASAHDHDPGKIRLRQSQSPDQGAAVAG